MGPLVGITVGALGDEQAGARGLLEAADGYFLSRDYVEAVAAAGGAPVLLPALDPALAPSVLERVEALLLPGGGDVDPIWFGEEAEPGLGRVDPLLDAWEIALVREAVRRDLPVLGICRGAQVLNVALGGSLYQDLRGRPGLLQHSQRAPRWHATHTVDVEPGSRLAAVLGEASLRVNSFHHQAVKEPAPGLRIVARTSDGVVEGVEGVEQRFLVGVQWHPETLWRHSEPAARLFRALVEAVGSQTGAVRRG